MQKDVLLCHIFYPCMQVMQVYNNVCKAFGNNNPNSVAILLFTVELSGNSCLPFSLACSPAELGEPGNSSSQRQQLWLSAAPSPKKLAGKGVTLRVLIHYCYFAFTERRISSPCIFKSCLQRQAHTPTIPKQGLASQELAISEMPQATHPGLLTSVLFSLCVFAGILLVTRPHSILFADMPIQRDAGSGVYKIPLKYAFHQSVYLTTR